MSIEHRVQIIQLVENPVCGDSEIRCIGGHTGVVTQLKYNQLRFLLGKPLSDRRRRISRLYEVQQGFHLLRYLSVKRSSRGAVGPSSESGRPTGSRTKVPLFTGYWTNWQNSELCALQL